MSPAPSPARPTLPRRVVGRRAVVAGTATGMLVAGCDALGGSSTNGESGRSSTAPSAEAMTGDDALTEDLRLALARTTALARRVRAVPGLAGFAAPYVALHRAHGRLLGGLPQVSRPRVRRQRARQALLDREQRLQEQLVEAARAADSGALAQAFASMAAAIAQQRAADG